MPGVGLIATSIAGTVLQRRLWPTGSTASLSAATAWILLLFIGIFILCYGTRPVRAAHFPILFLILMVPIPKPALDRMTVLLQRASCETTYLLMTLGSAPVLRNGFVLSLERGSIEVARECSGIHSTIGLLIGSIVAGHLFLRSGWKKAFLAFSVVPVSIFKNAVRIVCLYWLGTHTDKRFLTGELHRYGGIPFSLVALAILGPLLWMLRKSDIEPISMKPQDLTTQTDIGLRVGERVLSD